MQPRTHWLAGSTLSRRASQWCSLLQAISGNQTELVDRTADKQKVAMYSIVGGNLCLAQAASENGGAQLILHRKRLCYARMSSEQGIVVR
jgi:hypothetical protein